MTGREAIEIAEVPTSVGQRWIMVLSQEGLLAADAGGNLDKAVALAPAGISAVEACMMDAQKYLRTQISLAEGGATMQRV